MKHAKLRHWSVQQQPAQYFLSLLTRWGCTAGSSGYTGVTWGCTVACRRSKEGRGTGGQVVLGGTSRQGWQQEHYVLCNQPHACNWRCSRGGAVGRARRPARKAWGHARAADKVSRHCRCRVAVQLLTPATGPKLQLLLALLPACGEAGPADSRVRRPAGAREMGRQWISSAAVQAS